MPFAAARRDEAAGEVGVDRPRADEEAAAQREAERRLDARLERADPLPRALDAALDRRVEVASARDLEVREPRAVEDLGEPELLRRGNAPSERLLPEQANGRVGERRHARSLPRETRASRGAFLLEPTGDRPCAFIGVREQRPRQEPFRVVDGDEANSRVAAVETTARHPPEARTRARSAIRAGALRSLSISARSPHARSSPRRARARTPRCPRRSCRCRRRRCRGPAGGRRSSATSVDLQVADRRAPGKLVGAEERRVGMPAGRADELADEVVERRRRRPFRDQRQHDVAAVAVREALAGRELLRVAVEHLEIRLGRRELLDGDGHAVVREVAGRAPRRGSRRSPTVREQVLDRDARRR